MSTHRLAATLALQPPPATPIAIRDGAILVLTFAWGRRRAEIAGLNVEDLDFSRKGFVILTIRTSKTDQACAGQFGPVPRIENGPCAVAALDAWLAVLEQKKGPLFRLFSPRREMRDVRIDGRVVAEVVKRLFRDAGFSPSDVEKIAAHSLRRGFVTSADIGRRDDRGTAIRSPCAAIRAASCSMTRCCPSFRALRAERTTKMWSSSRILFPPFLRLLRQSDPLRDLTLLTTATAASRHRGDQNRLRSPTMRRSLPRVFLEDLAETPAAVVAILGRQFGDPAVERLCRVLH
jgi:hypothetical protein